MAEEKCLNNRDFLINFPKKSMLSSYLIWMAEIAVAIANITIFAINGLKKGFIDNLDSK